MPRSHVSTLEDLQQRAEKLYRLHYGTHEDLLFVLPLTTRVDRDADRIIFGGQGVNVLAVITRIGDAVTAHNQGELQLLKFQELLLLHDLDALNLTLRGHGLATQYALHLGKIVDGRDLPGPVSYELRNPELPEHADGATPALKAR